MSDYADKADAAYARKLERAAILAKQLRADRPITPTVAPRKRVRRLRPLAKLSR